MYLLDSDTLSLFLAGNERVTRRHEDADAEVAISIITRVEVLRGRFDFLLKADSAAQLLRAQDYLFRTESALAEFRTISFDERAIESLAKLERNKRAKKRARADLLIACITLAQPNAILVTRNLRDFQGIPHLAVENWAD